MTPQKLQQLAVPPAAHNNCNHPRLSIGLDSAYCPDCKANFGPRTQEYQNALHPPESVTFAAEYKVGDRVTVLSEPPQLLYQIVKLASDGHATIERLDEKNTNRRRVALWKLRPSCALADCSKGRTEQLVDECLECPLEHFSSPPADDCSRPLEQFSSPPADDCSRPLEHFSSPPADDCSRPLEHFSSPPADDDSRPIEHPQPVVQKDRKHTAASGWIEKYYVKRRWEHHRYCWQLGHKGKTKQMHIPKESGKLKAVRDAIAQGKSPEEIMKLLKPMRDKQSENRSRGRN